jgi:hypothetical protein
MSNLNDLFKRKKQPSSRPNSRLNSRPNLRPNSRPNSRPSASSYHSSSSSSSRPTLESEDSGLTNLTGLTSRNDDDGKIILMFNYFKEKLK